VNSDGVIGSFDLVAAFMAVANMDELDSSEFPVDFEATYFPFGDPSGIDLSDEADQELAKALASDGIERLFFALVAIPTAIAEHFLRLSLTGVALFLYLGVPFAMLFAFFIYTQAFLGAYLKQFINLLIETFMSVIIAAIMIGLLAAAAQQGIGLYIGAGIITLIVLLWRINSALKLAAAAFDLFGGANITGGSGGMAVARMGRQAVTGAVGLAGAALTGGATLAAGSAVLAGAAALQADGRAGGAYLGTDPNKTEGRVRQFKTIAGYTLGRSETARSVIEGSHEVRTLARNFRDGEVQPHDPDMLDYLRTGSSMSGFGSSPWLAMRLSPSLRTAYDQIGGRRYGYGTRDAAFDGDGEPVDLPLGVSGNGSQSNGRSLQGQPNDMPADDEDSSWREEPALARQVDTLRLFGMTVPEDLRRGQASDLIIAAARTQQRHWRDESAGTAQGTPRPMGQELLNRFASLEQALATLTEALTDPEGTNRIANGSAEEHAQESVNGPVPDWLREEEEPSDAGVQDVRIVSANPDVDDDKGIGVAGGNADEGEVQNVNVVSAAPDLDPDGHFDFAQRRREDKYETDGAVTIGTIRLETHDESRRQVIHSTIERLQEPDSVAGQAAHRTLVVYTGQHNADLIQGAVGQHTATAVQEASTATADLVSQYHAQGMNEAEVLTAFQSGEAVVAIREALTAQSAATPLSDVQLSAVADMVLLPQRRLTRIELVTVIGQQVAAGATNEQAVVRAIGSPIGFGGQTGNVRGLMAGARTMNLSPAELARLAELIRDGLRETAQEDLISRGYRPAQVREFVSDMATLPGAMVVPQTTAVNPQQSLEE
jgi:succinate dehydrogenase/fumarate reductase cytochrome b subunit